MLKPELLNLPPFNKNNFNNHKNNRENNVLFNTGNSVILNHNNSFNINLNRPFNAISKISPRLKNNKLNEKDNHKDNNLNNDNYNINNDNNKNYINNISNNNAVLEEDSLTSNKFLQINNHFNNLKNKNTNSLYINKVPINLEDLLIQEEHLWLILNCLRVNGDFLPCCEQYIQFSDITSIITFDIFFTENKIKKELKINLFNEYISIMLAIFTILNNKINANNNNFNNKPIKHLKHIFYYLHQNILLIISTITSKINKEYILNFWGNKLKEIVFLRLSPENKQEKKLNIINWEYNIINQNNSIIINILNNYLDIYFKNNNNIYDSMIYNFIKMIFNIYNDNNSFSKIDLLYIKSNLNSIRLEIIKHLINKQIAQSQSSSSLTTSLNLKPKSPFLPPIDKSKYTYSLVLDLDETLVHSIEETGNTFLRPGVKEFLEKLSPFYEIIIFTAGVKDYADNLLDQIDAQNKLIQHRLYREHTTVINRVNVKDIKKLGRDLKKVIIIDNISENFGKESDNGIFITPWFGDKNDKELKYLIPILIEISKNKVEDVRKVLRNVRDVIMRKYLNGDEMPIQDIYNKLIEKNNTK